MQVLSCHESYPGCRLICNHQRTPSLQKHHRRLSMTMEQRLRCCGVCGTIGVLCLSLFRQLACLACRFFSQHEERRGVLGDCRQPVGGPIGALRPTHGTHWLDRVTEQRLDVCLISGGFDWGALRPPARVAVIPAKTVLEAAFRLLSAGKYIKAHRKHRKQRG